jgi:rare lipoprotein A
MNAMTAAHRSLPFGTVVRVTNLDNHRTARVRINDRGPYRRDRIIDLSAAAARRLGMTADGTAKVRIEVIEEQDSGTSTDAAPR